MSEPRGPRGPYSKTKKLQPPNPSGLCQCGCGGTTQRAKITDVRRGIIAGEHIRRIYGHHYHRGKRARATNRMPHGPYAKTLLLPPINPSGLCQCGCGGVTPIAKETNKRDCTIMGQHVRFLPHHHTNPSTPPYRIEDRGYKTPCWIWQWSLDYAGYGRITREGKSIGAHRWYYIQAKGPIPDGKHLDHLCVVPACVNPDHLEAVAPLVNNRRRRFIRLSEDKAAMIIQLHAWGASYSDIGRLFGVKAETIYGICAGLTWKPKDS